MKPLRPTPVLLLPVLCLFIPVSSIAAEDAWQGFEAECAKSRAPAGLSLKITIPKSEFYPGERIPVEFTYTNTAPEPVAVETRQYDRSGRLWGFKWCAANQKGQEAPDPLAVNPFGGFGGGLSRGPEKIANGGSYTETFDANEWIWLGEPGRYELAVSTQRAASAGPLCSNKVRLQIRNFGPGESARLAREFADTLRGGIPESTSRSLPDAVREASRSLRFLHSVDAIPYYLEFWGKPYVSFDMQVGLYGVPQTGQCLTALGEAMSNPDKEFQSGQTHLYASLVSKLEGTTESHRISKRAESEIRSMLQTKTPHAKILSLIGLPWRLELDEQKLLAKSLGDIPADLRSQAIGRLSYCRDPEVLQAVEAYANDNDDAIRTQARSVLKQAGVDKFTDSIVADMLSTGSRANWASLDPKTTLTDDQQVAFAKAIRDAELRQAPRLASVLSERATSPRIVPFLREALSRRKVELPERSQIIDAWSSVDREGAKDEAVATLRDWCNEGRGEMDMSLSDLAKRYSSDPEVRTILVDRIRKGDSSAVNLAGRIEFKEAIPMILERAKNQKGYPRPYMEANALLKITSHSVELKKDGTVEQDRAAFEDWERWWYGQGAK